MPQDWPIRGMDVHYRGKLEAETVTAAKRAALVDLRVAMDSCSQVCRLRQH